MASRELRGIIWELHYGRNDFASTERLARTLGRELAFSHGLDRGRSRGLGL